MSFGGPFTSLRRWSIRCQHLDTNTTHYRSSTIQGPSTNVSYQVSRSCAIPKYQYMVPSHRYRRCQHFGKTSSHLLGIEITHDSWSHLCGHSPCPPDLVDFIGTRVRWGEPNPREWNTISCVKTLVLRWLHRVKNTKNHAHLTCHLQHICHTSTIQIASMSLPGIHVFGQVTAWFEFNDYSSLVSALP